MDIFEYSFSASPLGFYDLGNPDMCKVERSSTSKNHFNFRMCLRVYFLFDSTRMGLIVTHQL